jgi:non-canonical poly(A) RNA polymerase PAPD5/7
LPRRLSVSWGCIDGSSLYFFRRRERQWIFLIFSVYASPSLNWLGLEETRTLPGAASTSVAVECPGVVMAGLKGHNTNTSSATNITSETSTSRNGPPVPSSSTPVEGGPSDSGPSRLPHSLVPRLSPLLPPAADTNKTANASSTDAAGRSAASTSMDFATGADFIPFDFSDEEVAAEEEEDGVPSVPSPDKGKDRERPEWDVNVHGELKKNGMKRSAEVMEEGGYANKKQRTDASSRLTPWVRDVDWDSCRNLAELYVYTSSPYFLLYLAMARAHVVGLLRLHQEVTAFVKYISPTPEEHEVRGMVITIITRAIQGTWPDARVSPFGSYETKLYLPLGYAPLPQLSYPPSNVDAMCVMQRYRLGR